MTIQTPLLTPHKLREEQSEAGVTTRLADPSKDLFDMKIGVTVGKFMPPHKGHQLMIDMGAAMVDILYVIVGGKETDVIPLSLRIKWLREHYRPMMNVFIVPFVDNIDMKSADEDGTSTDEEFWAEWIKVFQRFEPTHFVSSDMYGKEAARRMGIEWIPVDPTRELVPVSATKIRFNTFENFKYIMDVAKPHFQKKIVLTGPESCGKSTMARLLAERFKTTYAPEYGRSIAMAKDNNLNRDDFDDIIHGQTVLNDHAAKNGAGVYFVDTDAAVTHLYAKIYDVYGVYYIQNVRDDDADLYLLFAPTVPWVDDGSRVQNVQQERLDFYDELVKIYYQCGKHYIKIDVDDYDTRFEQCVEEVNRIIKEMNIE